MVGHTGDFIGEWELKRIRPEVPRLAERILKYLFSQDYYIERSGDLEEAYIDLKEEIGPFKANAWLWIQIIKLVFENVRVNTIWSLMMFKFYLKTAVRNLYRFKTISSINIIGMSVGMAVCILLMLFVQDELSFDRYHQYSDRIYRILENDQPFTSPQVSEMVRANFPEIENSSRILVRGLCMIQYKEKQFLEENFSLVDPSLFSIFSFKFIKGNPATALQHPFSVVISEKTAHKYFGNEDPLDKVIRLENTHDYTITGVMEDMPHNSHFRYDIMATLAGSGQLFGSDWMANWGWRNFITYLLVEESFSRPSFEKGMSALIKENRDLQQGESPSTYTVQALKDIHLYSGHIENDIQSQGNISYVLIFSGIGILILIIACSNYIGLLTANAATRAKEVGIKKVAGSSRNQLVSQFIGESIVILMIALCIAIALSYLCLPIFNGLTGKFLSLHMLFSHRMILGMIGIMVFTGLLAGFYPAFVLSSFQPVKTLKGIKKSSRTKLNFGRMIVGGQFTISIILIICALFMAKQLGFLKNEKLGYNQEYIIVTEYHDTEESQKYEILKNELLHNINITSVTAATRFPSDDLNNWGGIQLPGQTERITMPFVHVNFDYFRTFGISPTQGRLFSSQMETDRTRALILNEAALKKLGLNQDIIGKPAQISWPDSNRNIIGIIKDFHFESLHKPILPAAFVLFPEQCWKMAIKVRAQQLNDTLAHIEKTWKTFYPEWVFEYQFIDERVRRYYESEESTFQLMGYFTFLAIFVSCLGLFGLVSFTIKRRLKEISIRKVLGAPPAGIFTLLARELLWGILPANLVAWPIAWYALNQWLQNFAYHTSLSWWIFILSGMSVMCIALLTMSWQTIRAATTNPIDSLKHE